MVCQLLLLINPSFCSVIPAKLAMRTYEKTLILNISYLSVVQQTQQTEKKEGTHSDEDVEGEGESTGSDDTDGDETEESSHEQLSSSCESDAELMPEEVDSKLYQPGPGIYKITSKPGPEMAEPPSKSESKAGKVSKRAKVGPQASSTETKRNGSESRRRRFIKMSQEPLEDICTSIEDKKSKIFDIDDCITHLHSSRLLTFIEKCSLMVKLLTVQNNKRNLAELYNVHAKPVVYM